MVWTPRPVGGDASANIESWPVARAGNAAVLVSGSVSQRRQECDEIAFLLFGHSYVETRVVEVDHFPQCRGRTVVEIRRTCGESAQVRTLELADVGPFAGQYREAGVGGLHDLARLDVGQRVQRHVGRAPVCVGN